MHDLTLVMHQARTEFGSVFENNNQYRTDVFDTCVGTTFSKPGDDDTACGRRSAL